METKIISVSLMLLVIFVHASHGKRTMPRESVSSEPHKLDSLSRAPRDLELHSTLHKTNLPFESYDNFEDKNNYGGHHRLNRREANPGGYHKKWGWGCCWPRWYGYYG